MLLDELIPRVRDHYVEQFRGFVRLQQSSGKRGAAEVKLQTSKAHDSVLHGKIYCVDYVENDAGQVVASDMYPDVKLEFASFQEPRNGADIEVSGLCWDHITVAFDGNSPDVADWFDKWFDPNEKQFHLTDGLALRIHSLSTSAKSIEVDFGTAPPDALFELIDLIIRAGSTRLKLSTSR